jgi:hypothetical protein
MTVKLTDELRQALEASAGRPVELVDEQTARRYVLVDAKEYERARPGANGTPQPADPDDELTDEEWAVKNVPEGLRLAEAAFRRDLPELMKSWWRRGKWVLYHRDKRIGIARNPEKLIRECNRLGLSDRDVYMDRIEPHSFEPEEVSWTLFDYIDPDDRDPAEPET